jgi:hypothetical protein
MPLIAKKQTQSDKISNLSFWIRFEVVCLIQDTSCTDIKLIMKPRRKVKPRRNGTVCKFNSLSRANLKTYHKA